MNQEKIIKAILMINDINDQNKLIGNIMLGLHLIYRSFDFFVVFFANNGLL